MLVGSPTKGRGVENGLLFTTLNGSPIKHCLLHSVRKVGWHTAGAAVEARTAGTNRGKWIEGEGGSEKEERGKVSYVTLLLLLIIIIMKMMRQRVGFLSL
ncbi:MAG: hypothetical protein P0116_10585 [Candidatus Nitrosocosmicus sp.]|nr:hypothetical protein [Candidatus Nitrosocosmicus sp.]